MVNQPASESYHHPVLADRVAELMITDRAGAYLDLTAGGGGHMRVLAKRLETTARIYGTDIDPVAVERTNQALADLTQFRRVIHTAFADIGDAVTQLEEDRFDGILLDLGISSYQLDDPERGLSFRFEGPLDMRLDVSSKVTAGELINSLDEGQLRNIISEYGEERQAARIARAIVRERQRGMILTTTQLSEIVLSVARRPHQNKALARVFMALRISVNQELEQLSRVLPVALSLLNQGGHLVVIAYHSLEDRIVKRFFQSGAKGLCVCPPGLPVCVCDAKPTLTLVTRKSVVPSSQEIDRNPRARSARLRAAEKVA